MAILSAGILGAARNKVGNVVTYKIKGQNVARVYVDKVSNPQSDAQMRQRAKLINLVAAYRANLFWMRYGAFENKEQKWSDYNAFVSSNTYLNPPYLTKEQVAAGAGIVQPFTISRGSLGAVDLVFDGNLEMHISNLFVGDLTISSTTTIGALSSALIDNNNGIRQGDQLSFIVMYQRTQNNSTPVILTRAYEIIIDTTSVTLVSDRVPNLLNNTLAGTESSSLAWDILTGEDLGGAAIILSRDESGSIKVSTQQLICTPAMRDFELTYRTSAAFQAFLASYGGGGQNFLSAGYYAESSDNVLLGAQIVGYREGSRPQVPVGGSSYQLNSNVGSIAITLNEEIGAVDSIRITTLDLGGTTATVTYSSGFSLEGNTITLAAATVTGIAEKYISSITIVTTAGNVSANFIANVDSGDPGDVTG